MAKTTKRQNGYKLAKSLSFKQNSPKKGNRLSHKRGKRMADNKGIPGKYIPGIQVSNPHTSKTHPEPHVDVTFNQGRLPGQLPLPFDKIHIPAKPGSGLPKSK